LLPVRGLVARRNGFIQCRGGRKFGRPVDLRIGLSRQNRKFRLDMHSISVGYRRPREVCRIPRSLSVVAIIAQSYGVRQIQTEPATVSDECAPRKRRTEARPLTQPQLSLHETL
jgi:hypothetical protein